LIPDQILYEEEIKKADWDAIRLLLIERSAIVGKDDCWIWTGKVTPDGYGYLHGPNQITYYVHRLSWSAFIGEIPGDKYVCHKCDNPGCINPSHLWLGTQKDNVQDSIKKNRFNPWGWKSPWVKPKSSGFLRRF
jgi:hypothetical protein